MPPHAQQSRIPRLDRSQSALHLRLSPLLNEKTSRAASEASLPTESPLPSGTLTEALQKSDRWPLRATHRPSAERRSMSRESTWSREHAPLMDGVMKA
jgi:hypothetical protein